METVDVDIKHKGTNLQQIIQSLSPIILNALPEIVDVLLHPSIHLSWL